MRNVIRNRNTVTDHNEIESVDCGTVMEYVADVTDLAVVQYHHNTIYAASIIQNKRSN